MPHVRDAFKGLIHRLHGDTSLSSGAGRLPLPGRVIDFMLGTVRSAPVAEDADAYAVALQDFNKIQQGRAAYAEQETGTTPVEKFTNLRGALTSYWSGEKARQAYVESGAIAVVGAANAASLLWVIDAGAAFTSTVASLCFNPADATLLPQVANDAGRLGIAGAAAVGSFVSMEFLKMDISRRMAGWMTGKFRDAALDHPDTLRRYTHNIDAASEAPDRMPDSPHETIGNSVRQMTRAIVNIGADCWTGALSCALITKALYDKSVPVPFLDEIGVHVGQGGTFTVAAAAAATYIAASFSLTNKVSGQLEKTSSRMSAADGAYSKFLVNTFDRAQAISESYGNKSQARNFDEVYKTVDEAWHKDNTALAGFMGFNFLQGFLGHNLVSVLPGVAGAMAGNLSFRGFAESQGLTGSLLFGTRAFFDAVGQWKKVKAAGARVTEAAQMFKQVADSEAFFRLTGPHDFKYITRTGEDGPALRISNLQLYRRNEDAPIVTIDDITIEKGDKVYVEGHSGCGKSYLFRALMRCAPYGEGCIEMAEGTRIFLARQEGDIDPDLTLSRLVAYGSAEESRNIPPDPVRVALALERAGLDMYIHNRDMATHEGRSWPATLTGGQKQRLMLARILYSQPDVLLLDEATNGLHPDARREYLETLEKYCPGMTTIAIMHENSTDTGSNIFRFNKKIRFEDGKAHIEALGFVQRTVRDTVKARPLNVAPSVAS